MKKLVLIFLVLSIGRAASVTIAESAYADASGRLATGTVRISWPSFSNGTSSIAAGSTTATVTNGAFSVALTANDTADPPFNYTAAFRLQTSQYSQQWKVPTVAGPLSVQAVTWSSNSPVTVGLDQLRRTGYSPGDVPYFNGVSQWVSLPHGTNGQVLTVDTSLAGFLKWATPTGGGGGSGGGGENVLTFTSPLIRTVDTITCQPASGTISGCLSAANWATFNSKQAALGYTPANVASNLSDLSSASVARANLGLGTAALSAATSFQAALGFTPANVASNLSDIVSPATARTNLGLGSAAVQTTAFFEPAITAGTSAQVWLGDKTFATLNSALVPEFTNLYFTTGRAQTAMAGLYEVPLTFSAPLSRSVNTLSMVVASGSANGYLSSADWSTFNAKQAALGFTPPPNTRTISTTAPITGGGDLSVNRTIACATCDNSASTLTVDAVMVGAGAHATGASTCTKVSGQPMTCADGFSTGSGAGSVVLSGATSGIATYVTEAIAGSPTITSPTVTGKLLTNNSSASELPAHASRHQNGGSDETATLTPASGAIPKAGTDSRLPSGFVPLGDPVPGLSLDSAIFFPVFSSAVPAAQTDLYTSPAATRTLIGDCTEYNPGGVSSTLSWYIKISGTYWRYPGTSTVLASSGSSKGFGFVLEPGESLATTPTVAGVNVWCKVLKYASTNAHYSARVFNPSIGQNTLYTVPAGKTATVLSAGNFGGILLAGQITVINDSGGTRTYTAYVVPSGGSPGNTNQLTTGTTATNASSVNIPTAATFPMLSAGDFISVNVDAGTATQWIYTTVIER